jgi:chloramphenicol-sensitive protein RarD
VTALPLLWFTHAARRLKLSVLGFFQYLSPSCQFLLAVFAFGEHFGPAHYVTFACIWSAIAIFTFAPRLAR